jgi:polycomb protein EED
VDCARWFGDFVFSRSVGNTIALWKPIVTGKKKVRPKKPRIDIVGRPTCRSHTLVLAWPPRFPPPSPHTHNPHAAQGAELMAEYRVHDCNIWFVKFGFDFAQRIMAMGDKTGAVYVWDLDDEPGTPPKRLTRQGAASIVRQVAFNFDGTLLLAACENGLLWRWDVVD